MAGKYVIERVQRPFWMHQLVEYLVGLVLISGSFHLPRPLIPSVLGVLVLLNAAIVAGPAAAFRIVPRRVHRRLDLVIVGLLVVAAAQPWIGFEAVGRLLLVAIAVVLFSVWFHTDFSERTPRRAAAGSTSEAVGRRAGRLAAEGVKAAKRLKER